MPFRFPSAMSTESPRRPRQAVFFLVDTQGANVVGCYRPELKLGTPNIDRLAAGGVRFERAYTCSPVCGPARSAIFTGLYPHSNGVLGNDMAPSRDIPTLGERLSREGIHCGFIGKWHLDGSDYFGDGRCPEGWDPGYWFDGRNYLDSLPDDAARDLSRKVLGPEEVASHGITSEFTHAHRTADRAVEFIEKNRDKDFFLVVSIDEPHGPFICPEPFVSAFEDFQFPVPNASDDLSGKPQGQREWSDYVQGQIEAGLQGTQIRDGHIRHPRFFACNSYSDSQVGRVIDAIDAHTPDALVTYTSDHGDMFGAHGLLGKGPTMYEEITRIPLIVRWPGEAPANTISRGLVSHIQLVPTFLEFFGVEVPPLIQGTSLTGQIREPGRAFQDTVFVEFNRFEVDHDGFGAFFPIRCAVSDDGKLALNLLDLDEFYELPGDGLELHNLIGQPSETRDALFAKIIAWMNETRDPLRGPHWLRRSWRGNVNVSSWGSPTRPRPFDPAFFPLTLLYDTARVVEQSSYSKE